MRLENKNLHSLRNSLGKAQLIKRISESDNHYKFLKKGVIRVCLTTIC
jgi:hypothetical protein